MLFFWLLIVTAFWTVVFSLIILLSFPFDFTRGRFLNSIIRIWARIIFISVGIKVKINGLNNLDLNKNYIFAPNHSSSLDIPLMLGFTPLWLVPIAKKELKWMPFLGWAMKLAGHIFIDRSNHEKAMDSINKIKNSIKKRPRSILLFPEGSRTNNGQLKRFKSGGLTLGIKTKLDIIPVLISGTYKSLRKGSVIFNKNLLTINFGTPINIENYSEHQRKSLSEKVFNEVKKMKKIK